MDSVFAAFNYAKNLLTPHKRKREVIPDCTDDEFEEKENEPIASTSEVTENVEECSSNFKKTKFEEDAESPKKAAPRFLSPQDPEYVSVYDRYLIEKEKKEKEMEKNKDKVVKNPIPDHILFTVFPKPKKSPKKVEEFKIPEKKPTKRMTYKEFQRKFCNGNNEDPIDLLGDENQIESSEVDPSEMTDEECLKARTAFALELIRRKVEPSDGIFYRDFPFCKVTAPPQKLYFSGEGPLDRRLEGYDECFKFATLTSPNLSIMPKPKPEVKPKKVETNPIENQKHSNSMATNIIRHSLNEWNDQQKSNSSLNPSKIQECKSDLSTATMQKNDSSLSYNNLKEQSISALSTATMHQSNSSLSTSKLDTFAYDPTRLRNLVRPALLKGCPDLTLENYQPECYDNSSNKKSEEIEDMDVDVKAKKSLVFSEGQHTVQIKQQSFSSLSSNKMQQCKSDLQQSNFPFFSDNKKEQSISSSTSKINLTHRDSKTKWDTKPEYDYTRVRNVIRPALLKASHPERGGNSSSEKSKEIEDVDISVTAKKSLVCSEGQHTVQIKQQINTSLNPNKRQRSKSPLSPNKRQQNNSSLSHNEIKEQSKATFCSLPIQQSNSTLGPNKMEPIKSDLSTASNDSSLIPNEMKQANLSLRPDAMDHSNVYHTPNIIPQIKSSLSHSKMEEQSKSTISTIHQSNSSLSTSKMKPNNFAKEYDPTRLHTITRATVIKDAPPLTSETPSVHLLESEDNILNKKRKEIDDTNVNVEAKNPHDFKEEQHSVQKKVKATIEDVDVKMEAKKSLVFVEENANVNLVARNPHDFGEEQHTVQKKVTIEDVDVEVEAKKLLLVKEVTPLYYIGSFNSLSSGDGTGIQPVLRLDGAIPSIELFQETAMKKYNELKWYIPSSFVHTAEMVKTHHPELLMFDEPACVVSVNENCCKFFYKGKFYIKSFGWTHHLEHPSKELGNWQLDWSCKDIAARYSRPGEFRFFFKNLSWIEKNPL